MNATAVIYAATTTWAPGLVGSPSDQVEDTTVLQDVSHSNNLQEK